MRSALLTMVVLFPACPGLAEQNWPEFRGPNGNGHSAAVGLPLRWSETENVAWKTAIHDRGWSSPVIWDRQVWLTTATEDGKELFAVCVDRDTGRIVHDLKLFDVAKPAKINPTNSHASPTPAVEDGRVYVHFGTYGTACLDTRTGRRLWSRRDLHCQHDVGPGSSVLLDGGRLILTFDGMDAQYLAALETTTGKTLWRSKRSEDFRTPQGGRLFGEYRKAFSTPIATLAAGRRQIVSAGAGAAMAYDPATGAELWKVRYPRGYSTSSRPLLACGLVFVNTGYPRHELLAVRPTGSGNVTASHVVWRTKQAPVKPSPVAVDGLLYLVHDRGALVCQEAKTGRRVWRQRIGARFSASPIAAEGRIYFFDEKGAATVIEPGRAYRALAVNQLADGCMASPAAAGEALFVRTKTHLYRIED